MEFFKNTTTGHPIVMGRKNIVISSKDIFPKFNLKWDKEILFENQEDSLEYKLVLYKSK